ncbi:MAG TPA: hypothetical protein VFP72_00970 [Kineosporiaceae bacterium]|nr:hypothetical protein [Kineosporiaceae bacterium]
MGATDSGARSCDRGGAGAQIAMVVWAKPATSRSWGSGLVARRGGMPGVSAILRPDGTMVRERRTFWGRRTYEVVHDPAHTYSPAEVADMIRRGLEYLRLLRPDGS